MTASEHRVSVDPASTRLVFGTRDANLKALERAVGVELLARGNEVCIVGDSAAVAVAARLLEDFADLVGDGLRLRAPDLEVVARLVVADPTLRLRAILIDQAIHPSDGRRVLARTPTQGLYIKAIKSRDIVFGMGPAGTGKTYLAVALGLEAIRNREVRRVVLTRPAVEAGERLGFLPGDLNEKVDPYLRPLHDALGDLAGAEQVARYFERGILEIAPLAFMRGRTLSDAFIILDEAQNTTSLQMKMFLTRMGLGSKMVITGDATQVDLPLGQLSGLAHATEVLAGVDGIDVVRFTDSDVVRHKLVKDIVRAYERSTNGRAPGGRQSSAREDRGAKS